MESIKYLLLKGIGRDRSIDRREGSSSGVVQISCPFQDKSVYRVVHRGGSVDTNEVDKLNCQFVGDY